MARLFDYLRSHPIILSGTSIAPLLFSLVAAWFYSRALLKGLASARDDHHRLTQQAPWFFFDREFKPRASRIARYLAIVMAADLLFLEVVYAYGGIRYNARVTDIFQREIEILAYFFMHAGLACLIGGYLARFAPKFPGPWSLAGVGSLPGLIVWACMVLLVAPGFQSRLAVAGVEALVGCGCILSSKLTWIRIRSKPNYAWFRFP